MTPPARPTLRRQLRAAMVLALIVVGILGSAWGAYRMTVGRPRLEGVRRHEFALGTLVNGRVKFDHTFVLTNTGSSTIEIGNIRTSCGCTVAELSPRSLVPGAAHRAADADGCAARVALRGGLAGRACESGRGGRRRWIDLRHGRMRIFRLQRSRHRQGGTV